MIPAPSRIIGLWVKRKKNKNNFFKLPYLERHQHRLIHHSSMTWAISVERVFRLLMISGKDMH